MPSQQRTFGHASASLSKSTLALLIGAALGLRLLLSPLGHPWDAHTWHNLLVELGQDRSPYDSGRSLSLRTRSGGNDAYYQYFTYPPGLLYLYYPVGKFYAFLHPEATTSFASPGTLLTTSLSWDFQVLFKAPIWLADFGILFLLLQMSGRQASQRYVLNPYVIFVSGVWFFDAIMVFFLLLGVYLFQRGHMFWSGAALAMGTLVKYVPVVAVPVLLIALIQARRPLRETVALSGAFVLTCGLLLAPVWEGFVFMAGFQASRVAAGMSWNSLWFFLATWFPQTPAFSRMYLLSGEVQNWLLPVGLLLAYLELWRRPRSVEQGVLIALLAYLVSTKVVNEVHPLVIVPFLLLVLAQQETSGGHTLYQLLWSIPLAWAFVFVPLSSFLLPFIGDINPSLASGLVRVTKLYPYYELAPLLVLTGAAYSLLCLIAIRKLAQPLAQTNVASSPSAS